MAQGLPYPWFMAFNPETHHRRSIRLPHYDYSLPGACFVTICIQNRKCLLGHIVAGKMILNDAGQMVERWLAILNSKFSNVQTDSFVIMPNHFHGIVMIQNETVGADPRVCPLVCPALKKGAHTGAPLHRIVQWFKTMTTNEYIRRIESGHWPPFHKRLWQRNYYEHVIRNEEEWNRIREYIKNNPLNWEIDEENPERRT